MNAEFVAKALKDVTPEPGELGDCFSCDTLSGDRLQTLVCPMNIRQVLRRVYKQIMTSLLLQPVPYNLGSAHSVFTPASVMSFL